METELTTADSSCSLVGQVQVVGYIWCRARFAVLLPDNAKKKSHLIVYAPCRIKSMHISHLL